MKSNKNLQRTTRIMLAVLLSGSFAWMAPLSAEKVQDVIDPRRASGAFVSDGAKVLSPEYAGLIDAVCRELEAKTTIEMAVVTVADLDGLAVEEYAVKLFQRFGVGKAGKDNGLLLLCSRDDRALRLEVGYGLEGDIPDALASRLLEREALDHLRGNAFGRGLFTAARDVAVAAAASVGVNMAVPDPASWPAETAPPAPLAQPLKKKKQAWDPLRSALHLGAGLLGLAALGSAWTLRRYGKARGRAARYKAAGVAGPIAIAWTAATAGFVLLLVKSGGFLASLASMTVVPGLATAGQLQLARNLRRRLSSYHLSCGQCGADMDLVPEEQDDSLLAEEEAAEEKAGGMDYEYWHCPKCNTDEKLAVQLNQAQVCPQCKRRTLKSSSTTLVAATREHGGTKRVTETCLNPKCNYTKTRETSTPRLSPPGSSSSSGFRGSSSRSSSFGGGRSGGGGASKKF
jgi:uncharacterized protein